MDHACSLRSTRPPWPAALALLLSLAAAGCRDRAERPDRPAVSEAAEVPAPARHQVEIPWLADDWTGAADRARADRLPVFIDFWAPWCHTCLSMKQEVMVDPALAPYLDRFVWLEMDTDKDSAAPLLESLPVEVWPTFYVVSPGENAASPPSIQARHLGAASVAQLRELFEGGEAGHRDALAAAGVLGEDSPLGLIRAGDRAAAAGDLAAADRAYGGALAAAPAGWPRAPEVLVKQISARHRSGDTLGCAELAMTSGHLTARGGSASATDFAQTALHCAEAYEEARARLLCRRLDDAVRRAMNAPDSAMSADDRSDALLILRKLAIRLGDPDGARQLARQQRDLLDRADAEATTAYGRMTYTWPRVEVYSYLNETAELAPDLEKMVAELPAEYDPPARLASVYLEVGRTGDALAMAERAKKLAYGPRKARVLILIGDIHRARGDRAAEKEAREEVVAHYQALPAGHRNPKGLAAARAALAEVGSK